MRNLIVKSLIAIYQCAISPFLHTLSGPTYGCRFHPTCSQYALEAFESHGWFKGSILTISRISRCNPLTQAGYDPVPRAISKAINLQRRYTHGP